MKFFKWKKHHKWLGIVFCIFMLMFCISGIILNHRSSVSSINIDRKWLPQKYAYKNWNNGFVRGTVSYDNDTGKKVLLFGNAGIWLTDSLASSFEDFNQGLPSGADLRNIRGVVQAPDGSLFCAEQFFLYRYDGYWNPIHLPGLEEKERLTDVCLKEDTLVVVSRSGLFTSVPPYKIFNYQEIKAPEDKDAGKVTLFRTVFLMHSGELFGMTGILLMDALALVLIFLCITGILYWLVPKHVKWLRKKGKSTKRSISVVKFNYKWHNKIGIWTVALTLFVSITGWLLRPPLMIPLVMSKVSPIPGTMLDHKNVWNDKLRAVRYDSISNDWLLSTSEGFYSLSSFDAYPRKIAIAPPVSVMGINVLQRYDRDKWLVGSFSGLFIWERESGRATDFFTGETPATNSKIPFGNNAITGYSDDLGKRPYIFDYNTGSNMVPMPEVFTDLPMSLWGVCLEIHTGRIYTFFGEYGILLFIFIAGFISTWILISGYKIRKTKKKHSKK